MSIRESRSLPALSQAPIFLIGQPVYESLIYLVQRLFGCWHLKMSRPFTLDHRVNVSHATQLLKHRIQTIPNVTINPPADVEVLRFTPLGPVLAVRPYCNNQHYWQVYFDTNRAIREVFTGAGFPVPEHHLSLSNGAMNERADGHSVATTH